MQTKHSKAETKRIVDYVTELDGALEKEQRAAIRAEQMRLESKKRSRHEYDYASHRLRSIDAGFLEEVETRWRIFFLSYRCFLDSAI